MSAANQGAAQRYIARRLLVCMMAAACAALPAGCSPADPAASTGSAAPTAADQSKAAALPPTPEVTSPAVEAEPPLSLVKLKAENHYVTSTACQKCHIEQYNSWHATYHRTMTQEATPETIVGNFDGELIRVGGYPCQPIRQGDKFYMTLVHPAWDDQELKAGRDPQQNPQPPPITYAVDRVIGSHHQQVYLSRGPDGAYHTLPLVWNIQHQRWITRGASFLAEPRDGFYHKTKLWNNGCVFCHNTGPSPGLQQAYAADGSTQFVWNSSVEELGIACEACHGPGGAHAQLQAALAKSPTTAAPAEQLIVNPLKLSKTESVLTCSRCHGKMIAKQEFDRECLIEGDFFQPGQWDYVERYDHPSHDPQSKFEEMGQGQYFWSDGTPRTTALEYQGLLESACYQQGEMTCLSCHSMHNAPANDQLSYGDDPHAAILSQNRACTQCHSELADEVQLGKHSRHTANSAGSLCYNCHMPYQAYSLLKRVRSHRITNPTATSTATSGIPNACNQCHVDQTLEWTNAQLADWQGVQPAALTAPHPGTSATVAAALAGHALQRALAIEQLGDEQNFELAEIGWRARILVELLEDDYDANRLLAFQALRKLPGFEDFEFDYIDTPAERAERVADARARWQSQATDAMRSKLLEVLGLTAGEKPDDNLDAGIERLIQARDTVVMEVLE